MHAADETREPLTIGAFVMRDVRAAADRCGVAPDELIEAAITRRLAELEEDERAGDTADARPAHFFEWTR